MQPSAPEFDRSAEDLGNIVEFGHVNITVPGPAPGDGVLHHRPRADPRPVPDDRGGEHVGQCRPRAVPSAGRRGAGGAWRDRARVADLEALLAGSRGCGSGCKATRFAFRENAYVVEVTCPGGTVRCHAPGTPGSARSRWGCPMSSSRPGGASRGSLRFYRDILGALSATAEDEGGAVCSCRRRRRHALIFRRRMLRCPHTMATTSRFIVAGLFRPPSATVGAGANTEESDQHQYRFQDIVDPGQPRVLFTVEHEVRSMKHPHASPALWLTGMRDDPGTYGLGTRPGPGPRRS